MSRLPLVVLCPREGIDGAGNSKGAAVGEPCRPTNHIAEGTDLVGRKGILEIQKFHSRHRRRLTVLGFEGGEKVNLTLVEVDVVDTHWLLSPKRLEEVYPIVNGCQ